MDAARYRHFLDHLVAVAEQAEDVIGLVVLGSGASRSRPPDIWSDHDIWLVTRDGAAEARRNDLTWLPDADRIVAGYVETTHGRSVVYDDGHLLELAVFDDHELEIVRVNDYRVLYDTSDIEVRIADRANATTAEANSMDPVGPAGRFVTQVIIGLGRLGRGERVSANQLIRGLAVGSLLRAVAAAGAGTETGMLDNLDPHRRVETALPEIAARIDRALSRPLAETARELVSIAQQHLASDEGPLTPAVVTAVNAAIDRAANGQPT